ncbi:MAG: DUF1573 domain-containing protein [Verrucomicrobia bacterium]|nr:DUF1573 domain-containing protein [Verrucomicrobiota bacterium]
MTIKLATPYLCTPINRWPKSFMASAMVLALVVLRADATPKVVCDAPTYDFGTVTGESSIQHVFTVRNDGDSPLQISRVKPSCGCTTAKLPTNTLQPGEAVDISTSLSLKGRNGPQKKYIYVESNDPSQPRYQLEIKGQIRKVFEVNPPQAIFHVSPNVPPAEIQIRLSFEADQPYHVTALDASRAPFCRVEQVDMDAGKTTMLRLSLLDDFISNQPYMNGTITVSTDHPDHPTVVIPVAVATTRDVLISPHELMLSATTPADTPVMQQLYVRNRLSTPLEIVSVELPSPTITVKPEALSANVYRLMLTFENPTSELDGKAVTIVVRQADGREETYEIPIRLRSQ